MRIGREITNARTRLVRVSCFRVFVVVLFVSSGCSETKPAADLRPIPRQNVLLITIDTLRADALGCYGGKAATPTIDRIASDGVRFAFAHAHAVVTLPSHASILTGQYPFQHGVRDNSGYRLPDGARTMATLLKAAGYETAAFVGAFPVHSRFGLNRGFDVYDDRFGEAHGPTEFGMPERPASAVVPLARQWISSRASSPQSPAPSPWFVWIHLFDPHAPYKPPSPFDTRYPRAYDGEVAAVDAALGPLVSDIRTLARPTLVVVTADHGEGLGEHGEQSHGLFAYESTLRVPLIVAELGAEAVPTVPDTVPGEVSRAAARHVDILPTVLEAVGQPVPADLPGRTLLPAGERAGSGPRASYFEAMNGMLNLGTAPLAGVIVDHDKFIDLPLPERYDLAADPAEARNLIGRAPDRDRTLDAALRGYRAPAPGARIVETPEAAAQLRALGYVSGRGGKRTQYAEADDPKRFVALEQDVHRAVDLVSAGRAAEALAIYQRVIEARPDFLLASRHLAFLEWQRGNVTGAIDVLQRAVKSGAAQPAMLAQLGGYLTDAGRVEEAIHLLEPLARDPSAEPDTLNTLGIALASARRPAEAARAFEQALAIDPGSSVPLENLGMLALERGDLTAARGLFERAIAADPRSSRAHSGAGVVALRSGNRKAAIDAWTRAVSLDATNFDALYNLATSLAQSGDREAARPFLERFLRTAPPAYEKDKREIARLLGPRQP